MAGSKFSNGLTDAGALQSADSLILGRSGGFYRLAAGANPSWSGGPAAPVAGVSQAVNWLWGTAADQAALVAIASQWSNNVSSGVGFAKSFDATFTGPSDGPVVTGFFYAGATGTAYDVVPVMAVAKAQANNSSLFAFNGVLTSNGSLSNIKGVVAELDHQIDAGSSVASGSGLLAGNVYNHTISWGIYLNGISSGAFSNAILLGGISASGAGLASDGTGTPGSLVNSNSTTYAQDFIIAANTTAKIRFNGTASAHAKIWNDNANNLRIVGGSAGTAIRNNADAATLLAILDSGAATFSGGVKAASYGVGSSSVNVPFVLAASGAATSIHTGDTALTTLATIAVPANTLKANGVLRITVLWAYTGTNNSKTATISFGGTNFTQVAASSTTLGGRSVVQIFNRNATNAQVGEILSQVNDSPNGAATFNNITATIDTTLSQNILLQGQLANSGDGIGIDAYLVEVLNI